jgi:hypothetical protein
MTIIMVMTRESPFSLVFDPEVRKHVRAIEAKYHSLIRSAIEGQLSFEPETETRNRKPLQRSGVSGATWELRFGPANRFRVFYTTDLRSREVRILAIGVKERNTLTIGGEEIET